jgi:guanine nucleotide-binding protein subunit alpha
MVLRGGRRRQPEVREPVEAEPPDPLLRALAPPADETPAQRAVREAEEEEARLVSERIDDEIRRGCMLERGKTPVKVVLLGPEWSGASALCTFDAFMRH